MFDKLGISCKTYSLESAANKTAICQFDCAYDHNSIGCYFPEERFFFTLKRTIFEVRAPGHCNNGRTQDEAVLEATITDCCDGHNKIRESDYL